MARVGLVPDPALVDPQHPVQNPELLNIPLRRVAAEDADPLQENGLLELLMQPLQVLGQARGDEVVTVDEAPKAAASMVVDARVGAAPLEP